MKSTILLLPLLLAMGCGSDTDTSADTATDTSADTATETAVPAFAPTEGAWTLAIPTVTVDSCSVKDILQQDGTAPLAATLSITSEQVFALTVDGQPETANCTLTDKAFTCDEKTITRAETGMDLTIKTTMSGDFTDESTINLTIGTVTECVGDTCAFVTGWPCQLDATTTGTATAQ